MKDVKRWTAATLATAVMATSAWATGNGYGFYTPRASTYEVTITNITKGQVFSPPVLVTHSPGIALFALGEPVLDELATVAEDGNGQPLVDLISPLPDVFDAQTTNQPIPPGGTVVYEVAATRHAGLLSVVSMLVNTNDAFLAIDSARLPRARHASRQLNAVAYDAGSEGNNEACAFVPGPACPMGSGNARSTGDAEGYVYVHNGIHDIGDLASETYDWRNPVARISVKRIH